MLVVTDGTFHMATFVKIKVEMAKIYGQNSSNL